jgi:hypothetical protein
VSRLSATMTSLLIALALAAAACGPEGAREQAGGEGGSPASSAGSQEFSPEDVAFGESLAQIRGHHRISLELYEAGDVEDALIHASHPIEELLAAVQGELSARGSDVGDPLDAVLQKSLEAINGGAAPSELESIYAEAAELTERAEADVLGEAARSVAYRASVVAALLATSGHEYEEAVGKNGIRLLAEYQDGYAFIREGHRLYDEFSSEVESASGEEAAEIRAAFSTLESSLPTPQPPKRVAPLDDVQVAAELIGHELEETVGAEISTERSPEEIGDEISELLDEIVQAYEGGDPERAAELSAEAYLENYEVIEADVIEHAPDINSELEPLLGAELRRQIQAEAPVSEIETMVADAKRLLRRALAELGGHS